jgi:hypothetical protein
MTAFTAIGDQVFWRGASLTDDQVEGLLRIFARQQLWSFFDDLTNAQDEAALNRESAK